MWSGRERWERKRMASRLGALEFSGPLRGGGLGEFDALASDPELGRFHQVGDGILGGDLVAGLRGGHARRVMLLGGVKASPR